MYNRCGLAMIGESQFFYVLLSVLEQLDDTMRLLNSLIQNMVSENVE
jgi:hypothetical protein